MGLFHFTKGNYRTSVCICQRSFRTFVWLFIPVIYSGCENKKLPLYNLLHVGSLLVGDYLIIQTPGLSSPETNLINSSGNTALIFDSL